jgi:hypothetical protein
MWTGSSRQPGTPHQLAPELCDSAAAGPASRTAAIAVWPRPAGEPMRRSTSSLSACQ